MILQALFVIMAWKEICAVSLILLILALPTVNASSDSLSELKSQISGFEDTRMNAYDLAFYLATHGYDASPKSDFVEVDLGGHIYILRPNGEATGLCTISLES